MMNVELMEFTSIIIIIYFNFKILIAWFNITNADH